MIKFIIHNKVKNDLVNNQITQMTWHPIKRQSSDSSNQNATDSPSNLASGKHFQRSVSTQERGRNDQVSRVKLGTVTRERRLYTKTRNSHQQTPSPTR